MKWPIILSIAWFVLVVGVCFLLLWNAFQGGTIPRREMNARATAMGRGTGVLVVIGWGVIWAIHFLKKRQHETTGRP